MTAASDSTAASAAADAEYLDRDRYDALVIGSGFGGAVATCRLAQAGVDVAVVERGRRWRPGSFPRDVSRLDDGWLWMCNHGLYDGLPLSDIFAVRAAGYGGGSLVYANVAARPPAEVFDGRWPPGVDRASLEPYFDLASTMLDVRPLPLDLPGGIPAKTRLMARAADRLGHADGFLRPNLAVTFRDEGPGQVNAFGVPQRGCTLCGECDIGCNVGAKNTLDLTYLAEAERHGAAVGVRTEAVFVGREGRGYTVRLREHGRLGAGRSGVERDVSARYVFLAAGALGTTELLLRSRDQYRTLPHLPPALGSGYSGNGDFLSFGVGLREDFRPSHGPTITTATVLRAGEPGVDEHWMVLEDGGYSRHLASLVRSMHLARLPAHAASQVTLGARDMMAAARGVAARLTAEPTDTAVLLAMGRDRVNGTIRLRGPRRRLSVSWDTARNDSLYLLEQSVSAAVVRELGGTPFVTPTWQLFRQPVTVHNLGGAPMGPDGSLGVVDADGEVFGHPGLYVVDGAVLPGATGGNPSLTITAVAERIMERALRRMTGDASWAAPDRARVRARPIPEDAAVRAVTARGVRPAPRPGVHFRETMSGSIGAPPGTGEPPRRRVVMHLSAAVPDLQAMIADPVHLVLLSGSLRVEGLTRDAAAVDGGTMHLLARVDGGPRRTMVYLLPFTDDHGTDWLLQGRKDVSRRRGNGPWRATTVLSVSLTAPDDRWESTEPTGTMRITVPGAVGLVTSLRPTGTRTRRAGVAAVAGFGAFFLGSVADAYLAGTSRRL
jgi:cholesterol oxidase